MAANVNYTTDMRADGYPTLRSTYGGFLFLGFFLGFVFLFATVLIIYYKQISEGYEDQRRYQILRQVGMTDAAVLLYGETGAGKDVIARQIHLFSQRKGPFVAVHPASTPEQLFESEFFGHEKGSFTGATSQKIGYFEMANGGDSSSTKWGKCP